MGEFDKVLFDGKRITRRQRQPLVIVSKLTVERFGLALHCYQGSWQQETSYSGTTHTKAGVCDLYVYGMSTMHDDDLNEITRLLRRDGHQAAQLRGPFCDMPWHWHTNDLDTRFMDSNAAWQVDQYLARGGPFNGLNAGVPSHNPYRPRPAHPWHYRQ